MKVATEKRVKPNMGDWIREAIREKIEREEK
jgi:hypothetical protein